MAGVALLVVVGALGVRVKGQGARQQGGHALVRAAGDAGVELDSRLCQGGAGSGPDAAADQGVHPVALEKARQGTVAAAGGADHLGGGHAPVRHIVQLELLTVAEVLKHLAILIGDCDFHGKHLVKIWFLPLYPLLEKMQGGRGLGQERFPVL